MEPKKLSISKISLQDFELCESLLIIHADKESATKILIFASELKASIEKNK